MGWRDLYAANQAVIERHVRGGDRDAPARTGFAPAPAAAGLEALDHLPAGPQRWFVHTPPGVATTKPAPLVVMLHGCTQSARDFAAATGMNEAADRHGFAVLYPEQQPAANQRGCWNWFETDHQRRGDGEPTAIAGATLALLGAAARRRIDPDRVFVAGLSAGGAMAAVLAVTHPELFAGVAVHSGLAYRSATTLRGAFAAMARGGPHPEREGQAAVEAMGARARPIPALILHGAKDRVVSPVNGEQAAAQWLTMNRLAAGGSFRRDPGRPSEATRDRAPGGRSFTSRRWHDARGEVLVEHVSVEGMGHAWSGGAASTRHSDPRGPSATEAICRFFGGVVAHEGG